MRSEHLGSIRQYFQYDDGLTLFSFAPRHPKSEPVSPSAEEPARPKMGIDYRPNKDLRASETNKTTMVSQSTIGGVDERGLGRQDGGRSHFEKRYTETDID